MLGPLWPAHPGAGGDAERVGWACPRGLRAAGTLCAAGVLGASAQGGGPWAGSSDWCPHHHVGPGQVSSVQPSLSRAPRPRRGAALSAGGACRRGRRGPRAEPPRGGPRPSHPHGRFLGLSSCLFWVLLWASENQVHGSFRPSRPRVGLCGAPHPLRSLAPSSRLRCSPGPAGGPSPARPRLHPRSEEHTSELQSR